MRAERHMIDPPCETTLAVLLERVSAELDRLTLSVDELQVLLSPVLGSVVGENRHLVGDIQRLDAIAQTLASLSTFVQGLGRAGRIVGMVDPTALAHALPLRDLADRLCGHTAIDEAEDFELF